MTTNVLIAFYSRNGSTEALANAVAEGAKGAGADVRLRRVRDIAHVAGRTSVDRAAAASLLIQPCAPAVAH